MNVLLDTSYFMPLIKVDVDRIPAHSLTRLLQDQHRSACYCEITPFELAAKGTKLAIDGKITIDDVQAGIDALRFDRRFTCMSWSIDPSILQLARVLREMHPEFIDCLILATACCSADALATLDEDFLRDIKQRPDVADLVEQVNPQFTVFVGDLDQPPRHFP